MTYKEAVEVYFKTLSRHSPEEIEESQKNSVIVTATVTYMVLLIILKTTLLPRFWFMIPIILLYSLSCLVFQINKLCSYKL